MKESRKGFVEIPQMTLAALKGLLFDKDGEIVLSSLIDDLSPNPELRDLTAINVGLAFKGLKPIIDGRTRFNSDYRTVRTYKFLSYSLILGVVNCEVTRERLPYNNTKIFTNEDFTVDGAVAFESIGIDMWLNMSTDKDSIQKEILERANKDYKPKQP